MKTLIIMMVLAMLNGAPSERITYYDYSSEEVTFELVDAYIVDMETGEKTPINVTVLEAD